MGVFYAYLTAVNIVAFLAMKEDKNRAKKGLFRIPEKTLFLLCFLGGSAGAWAGMYRFRHKTRKLKFVAGVPAILLAQAYLLGRYFWF